ncbi:hypothetical protein KR767_00970 [Luteibacter anthropi]|uniref:hypothetical protein n=1 Tax=Luteibacter anthropi TaxID=564369 RepID=UPI0020330E18|nr:hypothetical protein [Luteibacter anthropi]URX62683.1 hypothetical protein KR767_00970 [Luteibacter anthropi]
MKITLPCLATLMLAMTGIPEIHATEASRAMAPTLPCEGKPSCSISGFAVEFAGCGKGALFGAIAAQDGADGVDLNDKLDGKGQTTARLKDRQFVCIAATARGNDSQRHYVIAVPTASVPECKGKDLCKKADLPVERKKATTGQSCQRVGDGKYTGDCAAGWVDQGELDQYADGI